MVATPAMATDYLANPRSMKFHYNTCRTIKHPENFIPYSSRDAAINEGYVACKVCHPKKQSTVKAAILEIAALTVL